MKILWLSNIILPEIAEHLGRTPQPIGGWLTGMLSGLMNMDDIEISVCAPASGIKDCLRGSTKNLTYTLFPFKRADIAKYNKENDRIFVNVLKDYAPDIVHIWGTEYPHTLAMVNACASLGMPERTVINIQGLCSIYTQHYYAGLPLGVIYDSFTLRHIIFQDNIAQQKKKFERRGKFEIEALQKVKHVIGRTDWDRACAEQINPEINYHFCNEILRKSFYEKKWDYDKCEKYSIFMSQASYPIKGLHFMLEALSIVLKKFPRAHLYIAGADVTCASGKLSDKLKLTSYGKYIKRQINIYGLEKHITFCGPLNEEQMCDRYLKSNAFVSASSIENSPNSVCEAMILGMPAVSSDVGGVKNLMIHEQEGYLYQHDAPYMLAYYLSKIFDDPENAILLGKNARSKALETNNASKNVEITYGIYRQLLKDGDAC